MDVKEIIDMVENIVRREIKLRDGSLYMFVLFGKEVNIINLFIYVCVWEK